MHVLKFFFLGRICTVNTPIDPAKPLTKVGEELDYLDDLDYLSVHDLSEPRLSAAPTYADQPRTGTL